MLLNNPPAAGSSGAAVPPVVYSSMVLDCTGAFKVRVSKLAASEQKRQCLLCQVTAGAGTQQPCACWQRQTREA